MRTLLLLVPALLAALVRAQSNSTCVTSLRDPRPSGLLCGFQGELQRADPYNSTKITKFEKCRDSCLLDDNCVSFGYGRQTCQLFAYTLHSQGPKRQRGPYYYNRRCFLRTCGKNLVFDSGFESGPAGQAPRGYGQDEYGDGNSYIDFQGYNSPKCAYLDFHSTDPHIPNWRALAQYLELHPKTSYTAGISYNATPNSTHGVGYLVLFYASKRPYHNTETYVLSLNATTLSSTAGKWVTVQVTFQVPPREEYVFGVGYGTAPQDTKKLRPPISGRGSIRLDNFVVLQHS